MGTYNISAPIKDKVVSFYNFNSKSIEIKHKQKLRFKYIMWIYAQI